MEKTTAADQKILDKALANGTLVGYGNDTNLVHQPDGSSHDDWCSAMSMAGILNVLDQFYKSGTTTSPVLASAAKHWDNIYVSRYYDWHSGSWKDAYTHGASYKLKPHAPNDAVETLSKNLFVPLLEKLLADGTIHEYESTPKRSTPKRSIPFGFFTSRETRKPLDKFNAALREAEKSNPLGGPAFDSMVDFIPHRDLLVRVPYYARSGLTSAMRSASQPRPSGLGWAWSPLRGWNARATPGVQRKIWVKISPTGEGCYQIDIRNSNAKN